MIYSSGASAALASIRTWKLMEPTDGAAHKHPGATDNKVQ